MPTPLHDQDIKIRTVIVGKRNHFWHTLCITCGQGAMYEYKHRAYTEAEGHRCEVADPGVYELRSP